jgi:hypothetical protein
MEAAFTRKLQRGAQLERDYGELDRAVFGPEQRRILAAQGQTVPEKIREWLERLENDERARALAAEQERIAATRRQIADFAAQIDENGELSHPFFCEVETEMMHLALIDRALGKRPDVADLCPILADLYDRAVWANRATREKQLVLWTKAEAKRRAAERKAKAEAGAPPRRAHLDLCAGGFLPLPETTETTDTASLGEDLRWALAECQAEGTAEAP